MDGAADVLSVPEIKHDKRRQPYRHFMPSLSGATGLIDMPVAYTIPRKKYVFSAQTDHVVANQDYWSLPYVHVGESNRYFSLNYGATSNIEVHAIGEFWNKDFQYKDNINGTNPTFNMHDKFFLGFGTKWTFPLPHFSPERIWGALGCRFQFYRNEDRNVTEFHEYERFQNVYGVFSAKATEELFGHVMFKYISYDWRGGTYPAGMTDVFPGYAPTNSWMQWGLAGEWYVFPDVSIFTELIKDTGVVFLGNLLQFTWNVGARYQYKGLGVGFWAKRINFRGLDNNGIQASWKF